MAISHNLANPLNPLSGFDPVAGKTDGTVVGQSYVLRKIFDALLTFDSNIKEITSGSPTPSFLQSGFSSTLPSDAAVARNTADDTVSFYLVNDPGLSETIPSAFVYKIRYKGVNNYKSLYEVNVSHVISGSGITPVEKVLYPVGDNVNTGIYLKYAATAGTITTMSYYPNIIFWKSSNCLIIQAVQKSTNDYAGALVIFFPAWNGKDRFSGAISPSTFSAAMSVNNGGGQTLYMPIQNIYEAMTDNSAQSTASTILSSCGQLPSQSYIVGGVPNSIITGKLRISAWGNTFHVVSDEIEGISLVNTSLPNTLGPGVINLYGSVAHLTSAQLSDAKYLYRILVPLPA